MLLSTLNLNAQQRTSFFENTPYELNIFINEGRLPGPTLMVIGGIHDEPGGYLAADQLVDLELKVGRIIIIPRANFNSIIAGHRGIEGDMNRMFSLEAPRFEGDYSYEIVQILKEHIAQSDFLLNLHDGSGFYRSEFVDDLHQPMRFGQSVIADTEEYTFTENGERITYRLKELAERVIVTANLEIEDDYYDFRFNNHNTFSEETVHSEQRGSATFYALREHNIPAFGIETSKSISSHDRKAWYQTLIIDGFMSEFGIIPESLKKIAHPLEFKFAVITVNGGRSTALEDNNVLQIRSGDEIEVTHIETNYARGMSADIENYGSINDYKNKVKIESGTRILFRKDNIDIGSVIVNVASSYGNNHVVSENGTKMPLVESFIVSINGRYKDVRPGSVLRFLNGDIIKLVDTVPSIKHVDGAKLDLRGYVPPGSRNSGNDAGFTIDTSKDLLAKWSRYGQGFEYLVQLKFNNEVWTDMRLRMSKPYLESVLLQLGSGAVMTAQNASTVTIDNNDTFFVTGIRSSVINDEDISIRFSGLRLIGQIGKAGAPISVKNGLARGRTVDGKEKIYPVEFLYRGTVFGKIFIKAISDSF